MSLNFKNIVSFVAEGDWPVGPPDNLLANIMVHDKEFTFFSQVLKFDHHKQIQVLNNALNWFRTRFGLIQKGWVDDTINRGWNYKGPEGSAEMIFFHYPYDMDDAIVFDSSQPNLVNGKYLAGGFMAVVGKEGLTVRGTYGGPEGKKLSAGQRIIYGWYVLYNNNVEYRRITFVSDGPLMPDGDLAMAIKCFVYDPNYGTGAAQGMLWFRKVGENMHFSVREMLTFPSHMNDEMTGVSKFAPVL